MALVGALQRETKSDIASTYIMLTFAMICMEKNCRENCEHRACDRAGTTYERNAEQEGRGCKHRKPRERVVEDYFRDQDGDATADEDCICIRYEWRARHGR